MNLNALHRRLMQDVLEIGHSLPLVITGGYAIQAHQLVDRPSRDLDVVTDSGGAATDVGPVAAAQMRGEGKSGSLFASLRGILFACP